MKREFKKLLIVMLLGLCVLALVGCKKKEQKVVIGGGGTGFSAADEGKEEKDEDLGEVYIYKENTKKTSLMTFIKASGSYREYSFQYTGTTKIVDRFDQLKSIASLKEGDVYYLELDENTGTIKSMQQAKDVWVFQNVTKYEMNLEKDMLKVGKQAYQLPENIPVFDGKQQLMREQMATTDELTLMGYGNTLLSVQIATAHGKIASKNADNFENGYFVIANVTAGKIEENKELSVRAGKYLLKVAATGQGGSKKIRIKPGKTTTIDLKEFSSVKVKHCSITFETIQDGVSVYVDGKKIDTEKTLKIPYGVYRIVAKKKGCDDWSKILFVNSKTATITIDINEKESTTTTTNNQDKNNNSSGLAGSLSGSLAGSLAGGSEGSATNDDNGNESTQNTQTTQNEQTTQEESEEDDDKKDSNSEDDKE